MARCGIISTTGGRTARSARYVAIRGQTTTGQITARNAQIVGLPETEFIVGPDVYARHAR